MHGIIGKKIGMTQLFLESGECVPATAILAGPCVVTQVKTQDKDGYEAVQLGFGESKRLTMPKRGMWETKGRSRCFMSFVSLLARLNWANALT